MQQKKSPSTHRGTTRTAPFKGEKDKQVATRRPEAFTRLLCSFHCTVRLLYYIFFSFPKKDKPPATRWWRPAAMTLYQDEEASRGPRVMGASFSFKNSRAAMRTVCFQLKVHNEVKRKTLVFFSARPLLEDLALIMRSAHKGEGASHSEEGAVLCIVDYLSPPQQVELR